MKKFFILCFALLAGLTGVRADEGMWLLKLMEEQHLADSLRKAGLQLPAEALYSETSPSLRECVGIFGGMAGFRVMRIGHIGSPIAQGLSMGTAAHAVGTSRAMTISDRYGAFSGVALTINGILTALLTPTILHLCGWL